jgi:hypothetical protein
MKKQYCNENLKFGHTPILLIECLYLDYAFWIFSLTKINWVLGVYHKIKMDPALLRERELFKLKASAIPV